jgi:hypothetical protein
MKAEARARQSRATLEAEEASLRARLLAVLPFAAREGAELFRNEANSPAPVARYSHKEAGALYDSAVHCVELRKEHGLEVESSIAAYFLVACREATSGDPHRRGPRKLAEWLLAKVGS